MIPKQSEIPIQLRFIPVGTCLAVFAGGATMPEPAGRASIMAALTASCLVAATARADDGRGFGARGEWALSARCELPLAKSSDNYTVTAGCTYVFK